jgi:DNA-binding transcriptional regulator/RsmH inhibitor MraZ
MRRREALQSILAAAGGAAISPTCAFAQVLKTPQVNASSADGADGVTDPTVSFYRRRLDIRNRTLRLPVALRAVFDGPLVLTVTAGQCLAFYRLRRWLAIEDYLMRLPFDQAENRYSARLLIGFSVDLTSDARGRYRIPAEHLGFAGITHDVVVALIGTEDGRILDAERWTELAPGGTAAPKSYELNASPRARI